MNFKESMYVVAMLLMLMDLYLRKGSNDFVGSFNDVLLVCSNNKQFQFNRIKMSNEFNWKKFQFITEVQTALINNAINVSLNGNAREVRHIFSATGTLINMDDAFYAADRIPENMSAHEGACDFVYYVCENLREDGHVVPFWFARG